MNIQVFLLPENLETDSQENPSDSERQDGIAIVIDTLRFTTSACQALAAGAEAVSIGAEIDELRQRAAAYEGPSLLCGERHCRPIDGFQLGNSPLEYTSANVAGSRLFCTTTNGTRAVAAVSDARQIGLAALVNRKAVCEELALGSYHTVKIVCAGTDGVVALEDVLAAGAILHRLMDQGSVNLSGDAAWIALAVWQTIREDPAHPVRTSRRILECFQRCSGGRNLIETGYQADLTFAARLDCIDCVPKSSAAHWERFQ